MDTAVIRFAQKLPLLVIVNKQQPKTPLSKCQPNNFLIVTKSMPFDQRHLFYPPVDKICNFFDYV